jgi:hypothetical protein
MNQSRFSCRLYFSRVSITGRRDVSLIPNYVVGTSLDEIVSQVAKLFDGSRPLAGAGSSDEALFRVVIEEMEDELLTLSVFDDGEHCLINWEDSTFHGVGKEMVNALTAVFPDHVDQFKRFALEGALGL